MVVDGIASLIISSRDKSLNHLTELLGIEPTSHWERGDAHVLRRPGFPDEYRPRVNSNWSIHVHDDEFEHPDDETGLASLRRLADILAGKGAILESLRSEFEPTIHWTGDSDSTQGGFYMPIDLIRDLGSLGCDLLMTVNNEERR